MVAVGLTSGEVYVSSFWGGAGRFAGVRGRMCGASKVEVGRVFFGGFYEGGGGRVSFRGGGGR